MIHTLKVHPPFWPSLVDGSKPFEVRLNDRKFKVGDTCIFSQYDPKFGLTGDPTVEREITFVLTHEDFPPGVPVGYVVLGLVDTKNLNNCPTSPAFEAGYAIGLTEGITVNWDYTPDELEMSVLSGNAWLAWLAKRP